MTQDEIEFQRLHKLAGDIIANFSPTEAPTDVKQREVDEANRLMDAAAVVYARILARIMAEPVPPDVTKH